MDSKKLRTIEGWLARTDYEILKAILLGQQELDCSADAIAEIGVHHGKSSVALATFASGSKLYAIDLFDAQQRNIDSSGKGDKEIFLRNLRDFGVDESSVVIDARASDDVEPEDIIGSVGRVRLFHIDGGHHFDAVAGDIELATQVLSDCGVIAVDDVFRPEWPEVSMATLGSSTLRKNDYECFAIGFNKSYFCRSSMVSTYQDVLRSSAFLSNFLTRTYRPKDSTILVYQQYPLPEWGTRPLLMWMASVYKPDLYVVLRPIDRKISRVARRLKSSGRRLRRKTYVS